MPKVDSANFFYHDPQIKKEKNKHVNKKKSTVLKKESEFEKTLQFKEVELEQENNNTQESELQNLLKQIGTQGEKLKKNKKFIDLDLYKKHIKKYLSIVIAKTENTKKKILWDKNKKEKIAKIHFQIIDKELLELTRIFFAEQQNTLAIAAKIDKIEGLLIDLRS